MSIPIREDKKTYELTDLQAGWVRSSILHQRATFEKQLSEKPVNQIYIAHLDELYEVFKKPDE